MWIPTIEHLVNMQKTAPNNAFAIVEAWIIDAPNHGQAATINEKALMSLPNGISVHVTLSAPSLSDSLRSCLHVESTRGGVLEIRVDAGYQNRRYWSLRRSGSHVRIVLFSCKRYIAHDGPGFSLPLALIPIDCHSHR